MYFGTMSLNSSNFILPAGVSPICMSMKTMGLCILVDTVNESGKNGNGQREPEYAEFFPQACHISLTKMRT